MYKYLNGNNLIHKEINKYVHTYNQVSKQLDKYIGKQLIHQKVRWKNYEQ